MANILIVDSREAVLKESGDVILSKAEIFADMSAGGPEPNKALTAQMSAVWGRPDIGRRQA